MKKVSIVLLLVAIMVLSMTGCGIAPDVVAEVTPAEVKESGELDFKPTGTYNISGFGAEFVIHRFDGPNDNLVVYEIAGSRYLVGEDAGNNGTTYITMFIGDSNFVALSDKYLLFTIGEEKIAVAIDASDEAVGCAGLRQEYSFNDLSSEEKEAFVYPVISERVIR